MNEDLHRPEDEEIPTIRRCEKLKWFLPRQPMEQDTLPVSWQVFDRAGWLGQNSRGHSINIRVI